MRTGKFVRLALAGTLVLATVAVAGSPAAAAASQAKPTVAATDAGTIESTVEGTFGDGGTLTGTFDPSKFAVQDGQLVAIGTLHSVLTNADGTSAGTADSDVTLPVQSPVALPGAARKAGADPAALAAISCPVLNLVLGPLNLNLLGLVVDLNRVVLNITAVADAGNLLGNLLCTVVNLLNGGATLAQITALLNAILALLGL